MTVAARVGELRVGVTTGGLAVSLQHGGLRLGIERTWGGQTRAGIYYRAEF